MGKIKVFGIGLNKTGTTTLGRCFATLGYRHASVSRDLLIDWHNGILNRIKAVCDTHDSFEDWPYPLLFEKLFDWYGNSARYILTVRSSPLAWIRSLKNHSLKTHRTQHSRLIAYGYAYPHGLEQQHIAKYEDHNRKVRDFFVKRGLDHLLTVLCGNLVIAGKPCARFYTSQCPICRFHMRAEPIWTLSGIAHFSMKIVGTSATNLSFSALSTHQR